MRFVFASIAALTTISLFAQSPSPVTVLVQFEDGYSQAVYESLRQELTTILTNAGLGLSLRDFKEGTALDEAGGLVVIKFQGVCKIDSLPSMSQEDRSPLAKTHSSHGELLPFAVVACDRVRDAVRRVLRGGMHKQADALYGRALARVLAHELYHILGKTSKHSTGGVARASLSGSDLIVDKLSFHPEDIHLMRGF